MPGLLVSGGPPRAGGVRLPPCIHRSPLTRPRPRRSHARRASLSDPLATVNLRSTPQSQLADPRQQRNSAGGYPFTLEPMAQLRRFLVLGTTGGSYYTGEQELTRANAELVLDLARQY